MESFEIFVRSPFGKYHGKIQLKRDAGLVEGTLNFLTFSSDFTGAADGDSLSFKGSMVTPVGRIDYDARAVIEGAAITGSAQTRLGVISFSSKEGR